LLKKPVYPIFLIFRPQKCLKYAPNLMSDGVRGSRYGLRVLDKTGIEHRV
jgi:hypothetical protein